MRGSAGKVFQLLIDVCDVEHMINLFERVFEGEQKEKETILAPSETISISPIKMK